MKKNAKIFIAGYTGMVGSAILRVLKEQGFTNLIYKASKELDLTNQSAVKHFFEEQQPEYVFFSGC